MLIRILETTSRWPMLLPEQNVRVFEISSRAKYVGASMSMRGRGQSGSICARIRESPRVCPALIP